LPRRRAAAVRGARPATLLSLLSLLLRLRLLLRLLLMMLLLPPLPLLLLRLLLLLLRLPRHCRRHCSVLPCGHSRPTRRPPTAAPLPAAVSSA
jgi:hypothetical protein